MPGKPSKRSRPTLRLTEQMSRREESQELAWDAMEIIHEDEPRAAHLCREALSIYPDCVDALTMLAEIESHWEFQYVDRLRAAVAAGRRDLGPRCFEEDRGDFWGLIETRPFMRAMFLLSLALIRWGTNEALDEAIATQEEMLDLNPNDNQGVRDWLAACYLRRRRYRDAAALFARYEGDWLAAPAWARVLHAYATQGEASATELLAPARERNSHVEAYLTGVKRRPRESPGAYSPGDEHEAASCAEMLCEAWNKHPQAKKWLKRMRDVELPTSAPVRRALPDSTAAGGDNPGMEPALGNRQSAGVGRTTAGQRAIVEPKIAGAPAAGGDAAWEPDDYVREMMEEAPRAAVPRFLEIVRLIDGFCKAHLNDEYRDLCREMALSLCRPRSPILKGKAEGWAAGIVYMIGRVNFLSDPSQDPHMRSEDVALGFGVAMATMHNRGKFVRESFKLMQLDPKWTLPSRLDQNPLVWLIEVNGIIMDARTAPREVQEIAHAKGAIPYIPADGIR